MDIVILEGQSVLDIAVQCYGSAATAFDISLMNNISLTDDLTAGNLLILPESEYYNKNITEYFQDKGIYPATGITDAFIDELNELGIGEMIINVNFMAKAKK
jgi:hypothetical protein